jgi:DNA-binding transcriptional MerR regulator
MEKKLYSTKGVLKKIKVSRNTLFLWFKSHKIPEVARNRNGHRIFTEKDIRLILDYKNKLILPKEN